MNRPGVTVRYRAGYQPGGPPAPPRNDTMLGTLVGPVMPKTDLPLRLHAVPFFTSGSSVQLVTTLEVDLGAFPAGAAGRANRRHVRIRPLRGGLEEEEGHAQRRPRVEVAWPLENGVPSGAPPFAVQSVLTLPPRPCPPRASATGKGIDKAGSVYLFGRCAGRRRPARRERLGRHVTPG